MIVDEENYIKHYGILRRSGRYPWGSSGWGVGSDKPDYPWSGGASVAQRSKDFIDYVRQMIGLGMTEAEIAKGVGLTTSELIATKTIAKNEWKASQIAQAQRLRDKGTSTKAISERMDLPESTVRSYLKPGADDRVQNIRAIRELVQKNIDEKGYIDIGSGVEVQLGVSREKLNSAIVALKDMGYESHVVPVRQLTTGHDTNVMVMGPPGTTQSDAFNNRLDIKQIQDHSKDGGRTFLGIHKPISVDQKRLQVAYDEDGGSKFDGVIYIREGVEDLSLGGRRYAQVRILIDDSHYIKGMGVYKEDLPDGVDLVFNTNKAKADLGSDKLKALKPITNDPDNPFGSSISKQVTTNINGEEKLTSAMNLVSAEGDWMNWRDSLSPQVLSKQDPRLAKEQLDKIYERQKDELAEINSLTNPVVKKKLLETFADETDSKAVDLKAAKLPRQSWQVILPVESLKDTEVYAPNYKNGERVALIRYPHGGTFEIPELIVNNRNREASALLGSDTRDAIAINHNVANRLSGADFDGDTVLVIPNDSGSIKTSPALEGLKDFDPVRAFPAYDGMKSITKRHQQQEMGSVSNLITDMTLRGASSDKIARAVKHSMVVIDAEKHNLNWKESERVHTIKALKEEFQKDYSPDGSGGAGTIISRAGSPVHMDKVKLRLQKDGGPVDPKTGRLVYVPSGETTVNKQGERVPKSEKRKRLSLADDAFELVDGTGTRVERIYATHANKMMGLSNSARLSMINTETPRMNTSPETKKAYKKEMDSLNNKLLLIKGNRPRQRHADNIANATYRAKVQDNPNMDESDKKKIKAQATAEARVRVGLPRTSFDIEPREWEAIQAGVISKSKLEQILNRADMEQVRRYATPKTQPLMSDTKTGQARSLMDSGYTRAEVAQKLGVSLSTLDKALYM